MKSIKFTICIQNKIIVQSVSELMRGGKFFRQYVESIPPFVCDDLVAQLASLIGIKARSI